MPITVKPLSNVITSLSLPLLLFSASSALFTLWLEPAKLDPVNNRIIIGGNNISLNGQKTLGETLAELGTLQTAVGTLTDELGNIYQLYIATNYTSTSVVHTAVLLQNGVDISAQTPNDFEWNAKLTTGYEFIGNGRSITIAQSSLNYAHAVTVTWVRRRYANLLISNGNKLRISTGNYLLGRTEY